LIRTRILSILFSLHPPRTLRVTARSPLCDVFVFVFLICYPVAPLWQTPISP
jgi:hypothetical protein